MNIVKIEAVFESPIEKVWDFMTNLDCQQWRSQIERVEKKGHYRFREYDKEGYQTDFIILNKIENETYEFNLKNENMEGHWIAKLKTLDDGRTHLEMTEAIQLKKKMMKFLVDMYLKKQQKQYIADLKKVLGEVK